MTTHTELIAEYEDAQYDFNLASDLDSGDELSQDWLAAAAGRLEQARRELVQYEKEHP